MRGAAKSCCKGIDAGRALTETLNAMNQLEVIWSSLVIKNTLALRPCSDFLATSDWSFIFTISRLKRQWEVVSGFGKWTQTQLAGTSSYSDSLYLGADLASVIKRLQMR